MDNTPYWMGKWSESRSILKQDISKDGRLCVISASFLITSEVLYHNGMLLTVFNSLPWSDILLGTNYYDESCLLGFWENVSAMKTVKLLVHKFIIQKHPYLVEIYEQV